MEKDSQAEGIDITDLEQLLPEPYIPAWKKLASSVSEEAYSEAAFNVLKNCGIICAAIAGIQGTAKLQRNEAICTGLAIRLTKLAKIIVRDLSNRDTFQQLTISRQVFETSGTLVYLVHDEGSGERFDQYVQDSLISEKMVLEDIDRNIQKRGGEVLEIESRIRSSIFATALAAGITDVASLPARKEIKFPSAEDRLKYLGENVYIAYRTTSAEVHGSWTDLYKYHLIVLEDGHFVPSPKEPAVQPQVATTTTSVLARVFGAYLDWLDIQAIRDLYHPILDGIIETNDRLVQLHESFIGRRNSGEQSNPETATSTL